MIRCIDVRTMQAGLLLWLILLFPLSGLRADHLPPAAQQQEVTGKVADESGYPLPGVSVRVKGSQQGTSTDENGEFSIQAQTSDTLQFSFIGYQTKEVAAGARQPLHVTLEEDVANLDEVVVTGYMTQKKADLTGAISLVSRKDFVKTPSANVMRSLQGKVPGVYSYYGW